MVVLKIIFLFFAILLTIINPLKIIAKEGVTMLSFFIQAISITGFLVLQFNLLGGL